MMRSRRCGVAVALSILLGCPEAAARGAEIPAAATATVAPVAASPTGDVAGGAAEAAEEEEEGGIGAAFETAFDWFFKRAAGERAHERTWGIVPLVVASSNDGFGGGLKLVEKDLFGSRVRLDASGTYTSKEFLVSEVGADGPAIAGWFDWEACVRYADRPRLFFYGVGNDADRDDRASLALEETLAEIKIGSVLGARYSIFTVFRFRNVNAGDGEHEHVEPVSEKFAGDLPVGFREDAFANAIGLLARFNIRDDPQDPKLGFRVEVGGLYHGKEIGDSPFRFGLYWVDVAVYLPIVEGGPAFALHGRLESVDASRTRVPFYALPSLGGTNTLRGFLEGRIRDRHAVLFQAELRFPIWRVFSGAIFVDAGRVFEDITDPPFFKNFLIDGGLGVRFVLHPDIVVRLDVAFSDEETTFMLAFDHAF